MKTTLLIAGAILLPLGLLMMTGVDQNMMQAVYGLAMVGAGAWCFNHADAMGKKSAKHTAIKDAARNYGQAAVFIGTACLYMGTPADCDELCDDLWHHGQQAHVEMLTGEETSFNVL